MKMLAQNSNKTAKEIFFTMPLTSKPPILNALIQFADP